MSFVSYLQMEVDGTLCPKSALLLPRLTRKVEYISKTKENLILVRTICMQSLYTDKPFLPMSGKIVETSATATVNEMKKEPALEQIVDHLFEKAMVLLSRSLTSFIVNYFKAGVENFAIKYGTRPLINISIDEYHKDGGYVSKITVTLTLPAEVFERIKNRIRKEVYARRADTTLKASILRKLIINELKSSTYGISDLLAGTSEVDNKVGRSGAEDGNQERRLDNKNDGEDNTRRVGAVEDYAE